MPKLFSSLFIIKVLEKNGFVFVSQSGSHKKYRKSTGNKTYTCIIPYPKKEIPYGTFTSILRQSGLNKNLFE